MKQIKDVPNHQPAIQWAAIRRYTPIRSRKQLRTPVVFLDTGESLIYLTRRHSLCRITQAGLVCNGYQRMKNNPNVVQQCGTEQLNTTKIDQTDLTNITKNHES